MVVTLLAIQKQASENVFMSLILMKTNTSGLGPNTLTNCNLSGNAKMTKSSYPQMKPVQAILHYQNTVHLQTMF